MKNKLVLLITVCLFANIMLPKFNIESGDYETFCKIISNQPVFSQFCTLSSVPVKIVNELFQEQNPLAQHLSANEKPVSKSQKAEKANSSADFLLLSAKENVSLKTCNSRVSPLLSSLDKSSLLHPAGLGLERIEISAGYLYVCPLILSLLILFYVLPRGAIEDSAMILIMFFLRPNSRIELGFLFASQKPVHSRANIIIDAIGVVSC